MTDAYLNKHQGLPSAAPFARINRALPAVRVIGKNVKSGLNFLPESGTSHDEDGQLGRELYYDLELIHIPFPLMPTTYCTKRWI